ncbi:MAG: DUF697 domain-containing protein [Ruminococcaceae bacterium]|nr:DUF697 domain-containing protein [Oscillospiraceae bacterium]
MNEHKYTKEEIAKMRENAEIAVNTMTASGVAIGFAPVLIDVAALMAAMGVGVAAIAKCYGYSLNKEDAGELILRFFKAVGTTGACIAAGQKLITSLFKSNPVSYVPVMIADAVLCGSTAYAVGSTSEKYFRKCAEGKRVSNDEIRQWMKEGKERGKEISKKQAEQEAEKKKKD